MMHTPEEQELFELYGRLLPYGELEQGDGSERCLICRYRHPDFSFYVWLPGPFPVCGPLHAQVLRERLESPKLI